MLTLRVRSMKHILVATIAVVVVVVTVMLGMSLHIAPLNTPGHHDGNHLTSDSSTSFPAIIKNGHPLLRQRTYPKYPRRERCNQCLLYNYTSLISPQTCRDHGAINLFMLITSIPSAREARNVIRRTWASLTRNNTNDSRYVFLFGRARNVEDQEVLNWESQMYGDILQDGYLDSYFNLSLKVLGGYWYVKNHCPRARWILRTADDVYVNVPALFSLIKAKGSLLKNRMFGMCFQRPVIPIRATRSKYFVTKEEWPEKRYPPYCVGWAFTVSFHTMTQLIEESPNVPYFAIEDVYFGIVLKALKLQVSPQPGFRDAKAREPASAVCNGKTPIAIHQVSPHNMESLWLHCQK